MSSEEKRIKSRHLGTLEFFEILQIEWLNAELRHKIYPRLKDKKFWEKVLNGKKVTIEKIAEKNFGLPTIFTDENLRRDLEKKVYRDTTYPTFIYRNEEHKLEQEYYDMLYYYNKGTNVRCFIYEDVKIGKVVSYKPFETFITVLVDGKEEKLPTSKVARIL